MTETYEDFYSIDGFSEASWKDQFIDQEISQGVMRVFYDAGVEPICGGSNYIHPRRDAFAEEEYQQIREAAENIYRGSEEFIDELEDSSVHPQQTYQIAKARKYESTSMRYPEKFGPYDGMAVTESIQTDY